MSYGNYAPFYRGGFFNPMQQPMIPNVQENQFAYQQTNPTPPSPTNDMIWVLNETEATSYPVAPNNNVTLWDKNQNTVYIKSVNSQGVPSMRILDYNERTLENAPKTPDKHTCNCGNEFVRVEDFKALQGKIEALQSELDELKEKPKAKTVKNPKMEVEVDG